MVCTSLGSLLRPLFYFLCYIHFSLSVDCNMELREHDFLMLCRSLSQEFESISETHVLATLL